MPSFALSTWELNPSNQSLEICGIWHFKPIPLPIWLIVSLYVADWLSYNVLSHYIVIQSHHHCIVMSIWDSCFCYLKLPNQLITAVSWLRGPLPAHYRHILIYRKASLKCLFMFLGQTKPFLCTQYASTSLYWPHHLSCLISQTSCQRPSDFLFWNLAWTPHSCLCARLALISAPQLHTRGQMYKWCIHTKIMQMPFI